MNRLFGNRGGTLRRVVLVVVFALCSLRVMAQQMHSLHEHDADVPLVRTEWGVGIGAVYSMLDHQSEYIALNPRIGYEGRLHMGILLGSYFAIEGEICYSGASIDAHHAPLDVKRRVRTTTIDVPVLLSLRLWSNRLQFDLGPTFTVRSSAEYTINSEVEFFGPVYPTWNLQAGVGVRLFRNLMLDVRYIYPLADTHNHFVDGASEFKMRSERVAAGLTLIF